MTKAQFISLCVEARIDPCIVLESPVIRALLIDRAPIEAVRDAIESQF